MGYAIIKEREYYAIYDGKKLICTADTKSEAQNELDEYLKGGEHEQEKADLNNFIEEMYGLIFKSK